MHGDYKLDNVVVAGGRGSTTARAVAAVVDWEMATVGDPRADLGYLLSFWPEPGERYPLGDLVAPGRGSRRRAELVDALGARRPAATGR